MVLNDFALLLRVAKAPSHFLRSKSIRLYDAFEVGYSTGLSDHKLFFLPKPNFVDFIQAKFPLAGSLPLGASIHSYIKFLEEDNGPAFDLYVSLHEEYFAGFPNELPIKGPSFASHPIDELLEAVCSRPRMYFSVNILSCLAAMIDGRILVEKDQNETSPTEQKFIRFQEWVNARHPWSLGRPWARVLMFQNLDNEERAIKDFRNYFQLFSSGEPPDAMSQVAKNLFESNPGLESMSKEERDDHKKALNKIFH